MIINFEFNNFKSFKNTTSFSMIPGTVKKHREHINENHGLLTFAALYGANASGKSNFVKAIYTFQKIVRGEFQSNDLYYKSSDNKDIPTKFEMTISLNQQIFIYSFSILLYKGHILEEELILFDEKSNEEISIYKRIKNEIKFNERQWELLNDKEKQRLEIYHELFLENNPYKTTFLKVASQYKKIFNNELLKNIKEVYLWIINNLKIYRPMEVVTDYNKFFDSDINIKKLKNFLIKLGIGIEDIISEKIKIEVIDDVPKRILDEIEKKIEGNLVKYSEVTSLLQGPTNMYKFHGHKVDDEHMIDVARLIFKYKYADENFTLSEESDGTRRLLELFDIIDNEKNEFTYIIDELDRSLHPNLSYKFIQEKLKNNNNQLIITTHEDRLLDLNLVRRDEIWFVEKEKFSKIYSLEEFKVRFDKSIVKNYLEGRYGAIPHFKFIKED